MKLDDSLGAEGMPDRQSSLVDPLLDGHVRFRLELQIALLSVVAVVILERTLDVDRMGIVALDQVRVVAVHRADQAGEGHLHRARKTAAEGGRLLNELERQVVQPAPMTGGIRDDERLHRSEGFLPVDRF